MTKRIKLTQGKYALVDDEDFDRVSQLEWHAHLDHCGKFYARSGPKTVQMHRFILGVNDRKVFVDHINGNSLDNRRKNLRLATNQQNQANMKVPKNNSSGFKGVQKYGKKWRAGIFVDGDYSHIGVFDTPLDGARAYNRIARKIFGAFARLNKLK